MSVSGPSPLGTLMVQRVEAALGATGAQQANVATGARPDAVTQPGQPDKTDPAKNPPPKEQEGSRRAQGRQAGLAELARNNPEIAKMLAARNAPMTSYTASAPTSLGQAAKTILALLLQFPDAKPAVTGRAPLLSQAPGQGATGQGAAAGGTAQAGSTRPAAGNLDPRAVEALMQRAAGGGNTQSAAANSAAAARAALAGAPAQPGAATPGQPAAPAPGLATPAGLGPGGLPLPGGMAGQLMQALSQAMQGSGLFYESHLRSFTFGQRSLAQMQSEPQAQAGREAARAPSADPAQGRGAGEANTQGSQASQAASSAQSAQQSAQLTGALLSMDPSTHALVRQQLETLANQAFAWQGEAWPGGDLEWEVQRREPQGGQDETESWATQLKLKLPGLGEVMARLSLSETQLVMHLSAPESAGLMADHTGLLRERLGLHGLQLSQLTISRETSQDTPEQA